MNPRHPPTGIFGIFFLKSIIIHLDQTRAPANARGKKLPPSVSSSKKNISVVKEEDEDVIEEVNISNNISR